MVSPSQNTDAFVQRIGIYLLNSLACQVDGKEKQTVGSLGAMEVGVVRVSSHTNVTQQLSHASY